MSGLDEVLARVGTIGWQGTDAGCPPVHVCVPQPEKALTARVVIRR